MTASLRSSCVNIRLTACRESEFVQALRAEAAYVNVHTGAFGAGEIRGQVTFNRSDSVNDD